MNPSSSCLSLVPPPVDEGTRRQRRCRIGSTRGYTIIELMIVVAIVGVLAALATFGVRRYLAASKAAEAKEKVGSIAQAAVAAYHRQQSSPQAVVLGVHTGDEHQLCTTSTWVPDSVNKVKGRKYQPNTANGQDFNTGSQTAGWMCLRFSIQHPVSYQYNYSTGPGADWSGNLASPFFVARAQGDLDSDDTYARFLRGGVLANNAITMQTAVWVSNETE